MKLKLRTPVAAALLLAVLAIMQVQYPIALTATVWRVAMLSWDNPATVAGQELAMASAPHDDPYRRVTGQIEAAVRPVARLIRGDRPSRPHGFDAFTEVPRSPPTS
ncbi:MAG: hypothetical protein HY216_04985 [Candidatus Rokubacteria bacterium]|nr:hypothetical protein [Candidatus Rokubacteria bacterium]